MEIAGREVEFARRLSVSDKVGRDRALKKLKTWLYSRSQPNAEFGVEEMMKLWRGLHYCMWMSDKPLVQEECAKNISSLIHSFASEFFALQFIDCGWLTLSQEWHNIDRLRMDKYLMFVRHYLRQNFAFLKNRQWESKLVDQLMENFTIGILEPNSEDVPVGIQLQLTDIYVPVLEDIAAKAVIPVDVVNILLKPFVALTAQTKKPVLMKAACHGVVEPLLQLPSVHALAQSCNGTKSGQQQDSAEEDSDDGFEDEKPSPLKVDHGELSTLIFSIASEESVPHKNRSALYMLKRQFDALAVTQVACAPPTSTADGRKRERQSSVEEDMGEEETQEAPKEEEMVVTEKKQKSPKNFQTPDSSPKKKKKRIRLSLESNQIKQFSKKDPIDVSPWKPDAKEGKSLLKNRTPTPITPRMQRMLARSQTGRSPSASRKSSATP